MEFDEPILGLQTDDMWCKVARAIRLSKRPMSSIGDWSRKGENSNSALGE